MKSFFRQIAIISTIAITTLHCGITKPDYVKYDAATSATPTPACDGAVSAFSDNIQPTVESTCGTAGCHGATQSIQGSYFKSGDPENNRTVLLKFVGSDASKLDNKLRQQEGVTHTGGTQSAPSLEQIEEWLAAEAECE